MKKPLEILVAEHDPDVAEGLCDVLRAVGHNVSRAYSAKEACDLLRSQDFDAGFLNIKIPGLTRLEGFARVRKIKPDANLVMMSAHTIDKLIAEITHDGGVRVLIAPVAIERVAATLKDIGESGTVLIEDASADLAADIESGLRERNAKVAVVNEVDMDFAAVAQGDYEVALLDLGLPIMRTLEVYLELRQKGLMLPTIIFHSYAGASSAGRSISEIDILFKPFDPAVMVALLDELAAWLGEENNATSESAGAVESAPRIPVAASFQELKPIPEKSEADDLSANGAPEPGNTERPFARPDTHSVDAETPANENPRNDGAFDSATTELWIEDFTEQPWYRAEVGITDEPLERPVQETGSPVDGPKPTIQETETAVEETETAVVEAESYALESEVLEAETAERESDVRRPIGAPNSQETLSQEIRVLVVDDDTDVADGLADLLSVTGLTVKATYGASEALAALEYYDADIAFVDVKLGESNGLDLTADLHRLYPEIVVVIITGQTELQTAIEALRKGAFDYLNKPIKPEELLAAMKRYFDESAKGKDQTNPYREDLTARNNPTHASYLTNLGEALGISLANSDGFSGVLNTATLDLLSPNEPQTQVHDPAEVNRHLVDVMAEYAEIDLSEDRAIRVNDDAVDLTRVIYRCMEHIRATVDAIDLTVEIELAEIPVFMIGDQKKLTQIILTLLTNAVKYTPKGNTIRFVQRRHNDGGILIEVIDSGIGMSEEVMARALTPVISAEGNLVPEYEGDGLSLPMAYSMAELLGAEIGLKSEVGKGTIATLHLPNDRNIALKSAAIGSAL